jgi:transposase
MRPEAEVASEPEALVAFLRDLGVTIVRAGLEAGPLSQWLYGGLHKAGFEAVLLETRHVKAALSAMTIKTDRRDARGIAQLLRMGWYRPVHRKSLPSQEVRALLGASKQMQIKAMDLEHNPRSIAIVGATPRMQYGGRMRRPFRLCPKLQGHPSNIPS